MAKTDNEKLAERLDEIQNLLTQKTQIEERLKILTGVKQEDKKVTLPKPPGFSLMKAINEAIKEGGPMTSPQLTVAIGKKWNIGLDVKNVRATAQYMVKRGQLKVDENKVFSLV